MKGPDDSGLNRQPPTPVGKLDAEPWEAEVRREMEPIFEAVRNVKRELETLANQDEFEELLKPAQLGPQEVFRRGEDLWNQERDINKIIGSERNHDGLDKAQKAVTHLLDTTLNGSSGVAISQIFRLGAFIQGYAAIYADPKRAYQIVDNRLSPQRTEKPLNKSAMNNLSKQGNAFSDSVTKLQKAFAKVGINFHIIHFLEDIKELEAKLGQNESGKSKISVKMNLSPFSNLGEVGSVVWHRIERNKKDGGTNNTIADISLWGYDSKRFPGLNSPSNIYGWYS